jgi:hypothetical protein
MAQYSSPQGIATHWVCKLVTLQESWRVTHVRCIGWYFVNTILAPYHVCVSKIYFKTIYTFSFICNNITSNISQRMYCCTAFENHLCNVYIRCNSEELHEEKGSEGWQRCTKCDSTKLATKNFKYFYLTHIDTMCILSYCVKEWATLHLPKIIKKC